MSKKKLISRRTFLKGAAVAAAAPYVITSFSLAGNGTPAPSNRIVMGCIGVGSQGSSNMGAFLGFPDLQIVAVCDVDKNNVNNAKKTVDGRYSNADCKTYGDFRELIARPDIDAISLATPDHWHGAIAVAAAKAGKDIFGEKPITHSLAEGRALADTVKRYGRVWQTGSWQRSVRNFRYAAELVRNGRIGKVVKVEVGLPAGGGDDGRHPFREPPAELDYNFWVGPSAWTPYCPERVHWNWRWQMNYGGGQLMDWVGHHVDIAHWGMDCDYTGPIEIECTGTQRPEGIYDSAPDYTAKAKYKNGIEMTVSSRVQMGAKWIGEDGRWIWVDRGGFDANPKSLLQEKIGAGEINLYRSDNHQGNFLDCVKSRSLTVTPAEVAHRSASVGHLAVISMKLGGRKLKWNPDTEQFINDPDATRLLGNAMRSPWHV